MRRSWKGVITVIAILSLGSLAGCTSAGLGAIAGLGTAVLATGSQQVGQLVAQDIADQAAYRARRDDFVAQVMGALMMRARQFENEDWGKAVEVYNAAARFLVANRPRIFVARVRDQLKDGKADEALILPAVPE